MKYKCLVFDHDDTTVNSTATLHWPSFQAFLDKYRPGRSISLEDYFIKNFHPGFIPMCTEDFGLSAEELEIEVEFWKDYVSSRIPKAYEGIREIMLRQRQEGGIIAVISHSFKENIFRDYKANALPEPDAIYGWEQPPERRKPNVWPLEELMARFGLERTDILVIDDLKPGFDMARAAQVPFAAAGWSNDIEEIESFMRANCGLYFKTVQELSDYLK